MRLMLVDHIGGHDIFRSQRLPVDPIRNEDRTKRQCADCEREQSDENPIEAFLRHVILLGNHCGPRHQPVASGRSGRPKRLGQITAGCSGEQDPQNAIEDTAVVYPRNATRLVREHRLDGKPFMVGEFVAHERMIRPSV